MDIEVKTISDLRNLLNYVYKETGLKLKFDFFGYLNIFDLERQLLDKFGYFDISISDMIKKRYGDEIHSIIKYLLDVKISDLLENEL